MRVGTCTDHDGFSLKEELMAQLRANGREVVDSLLQISATPSDIFAA